MAMRVAHEHGAAIFSGEGITQVEGQACVGMAAAGDGIGCAASAFGPVAATPVEVIAGGIDLPVNMRIEIVSLHPLVMSALDHMPEVGDDVVGHEHLAMFVVIQAPGIGGAFGEALELFL